MQFQVQAGAPGKKTSGAPNWRRKGKHIIELSNFIPSFGLKIRNVVFLNSIIMMFSFFYVSPVFQYASAVPSLKL